MAREYKPNFMDAEQDNSGLPTSPGTQGAVPTGSSFAAPKARKASSGFTNLKKYFNANQGNKLIESVAKPAETQLQGAQQNLAQSSQQFNQDIQNEQAKLAAARTQGQQALGYVDTGANALTPQSLPQDATEEQKAKAAIDANNAAQQALTKVRDYRYSGPTEIANQDKLMDDRFQLQDFAQATKNEAGRGAILQTLFGKGGNYTGGARNLDNFLLSADQQNLNKLKDIRSQTQKYDQDLRNLDTQAAAKVGAAMGNVDMTKGLQKTAMEKMREALKLRLEEQAKAYNTASQADAAAVTTDELRQWLPEMAGYDLVGDPRVAPATEVGLPVESQAYLDYIAAGGDPNSPDAPAKRMAQPMDNMSLPVEPSPEELNFINLYKNRNFEDRQKVDPNETFTRDIKEAGSMFHRDWNHSTVGAPNKQEAFVGIDAMKPLFSESYQDNTWDSINAQELERRNILSRVLADNVENGLMTPKQKQEIQTQMDNELLSKLKETPNMARGQYAEKFFTSAPGNISDMTSDYKKLGYTNVADLMKDLNMTMAVGLQNLPGFENRVNDTYSHNNTNYTYYSPFMFGGTSTNSWEFNPETGKMRMKNGQKIPTGIWVNNKTGQTTKLPVQTQNGPNQMAELSKLGFEPQYIDPPEITPEQLDAALVHGKGGFDNNSSPRLIANKWQEKYLKDRLNELLGAKHEDVLVKK